MEREITQPGENAMYFENFNGNIYHGVKGSDLTNQEITEKFQNASVDISTYNNLFGNRKHIKRTETDDLYSWINGDLAIQESPIAILVGNAGCGKSVILRDLYDKLRDENIPALGIKADRLFIHNLDELNNELLLGDNIEAIFKKLSSTSTRFVFLVDQIDALSQSLSSDRNPLNTYHRLLLRLSNISNIRIVISCRLYDLDYDPLLQEYKNKRIFKTSLLTYEEIDSVLTSFNIEVSKNAVKLKEFLRIPLHLQLFTKLQDRSKFDEFITLQTLYDELWNEFVLTKPSQFKLTPEKIQNLIEDIANKMYEYQQLYLDRRLFDKRYKKELEYLFTEEIITNTDQNKIQFIHQSFFDYAYARTFIEKNVSISDSIKLQHQGLFIRSRVKQVMSYLRDLDVNQYIVELDNIIFSDNRFHIKLLLINSLGFQSNPLKEETYWVKAKFPKEKFLFGLFIESIQTDEWFKYFIENMNPYAFFQNNDEEFINNIYRLCWRLVHTSTIEVIDFLTKIDSYTFTNKHNFIGNIISSIQNEKINLSFSLYFSTSSNWDRFNLYHYLDNVLIFYPDFVINELHRLLDLNLESIEDFKSDYIPGDYNGLNVYKNLYEKHKEIAIPFYIDVITKISEATKIKYIDETKNINEIFNSTGFIIYAPFKGYRHAHQEVYELILNDINKNNIEDFEKKCQLYLPLLSSDLALIVNLPIQFIILNVEKLVDKAFEVLSDNRYYNSSSEILTYNIKSLLKLSYSQFSSEQQIAINKTLLNINPYWEKGIDNSAKGVTKYGYTRIGYTAYCNISMIPEEERTKYKNIDAFFKEKNRQFGAHIHKEPQGVECRVGDTILPEKAYEKMTDSQWIDSFRKFISDSHFDWNTPTRTGHCRKFEQCVSESPDRFIKIIRDIISDKTILPIYAVYGLQGLKNAKYNPHQTKEIFNLFLTERFYNEDLDKESLQYSVWLIEYFINTLVIDQHIVDFLKNIVLNYPESEMLNNDPISDGINSIRGAACSKLVSCYRHKEFSEDIFSTLENMASNGSVHTRAATIYQQALLNHLDKERNLGLYLSLVHDYDVNLLKLPLHNLHPLVYLIHVDFSRLIDFFKRAIKIEEAHKSMSHILFLAWLESCNGSEDLFNEILDSSQTAKQTIIKIAFELLRNTKERHEEKIWKIIYKYLNEDDEEIGKIYEFGLHYFEENFDEKILSFLHEYTCSIVGKYRSHYYYNLLLKISKDFPIKVINWVLTSEDNFISVNQLSNTRNEPLQVILLAYNAIREYDKKDDTLEMAMDAFDKILIIPEYRNLALDVLKKIDA